ncbi:C-terminal domain phosphatase-like 4 [Striga asiatica]|uniref:C-terminal domain phosphatase-like 4 n=1 Tax=Striga asiatica TaxID=4170 RepID=A0A5A7P0I4_STRAF|nr:C-terminal domain phosphatase-like 4 [Striga asiatica]
MIWFSSAPVSSLVDTGVKPDSSPLKDESTYKAPSTLGGKPHSVRHVSHVEFIINKVVKYSVRETRPTFHQGVTVNASFLWDMSEGKPLLAPSAANDVISFEFAVKDLQFTLQKHKFKGSQPYNKLGNPNQHQLPSNCGLHKIFKSRLTHQQLISYTSL